MKCVAIIPARGGSKGVPLKNLRKLGGARLLVRSIQAAQQCELVSDVYVTTDCPEHSYVATKVGAKVIMRPDSLATDEASSESALHHALLEIEKSAALPDCVAFLQCTSPYTTPGEIHDILLPLLNGTADSTFSATRAHGFLWRATGHGSYSGINHDPQRPRQRRQDLAPEYLETGAAYGFMARNFLEKRNRFIGNIIAVEAKSTPADIDTMEDMIKAQKACGRLIWHPPTCLAPKAIITDFDGVHTDGKVTVAEDGSESVICNRRDGLGIEIARANGLKVLILSREQNGVVEARARKLKVDCIQGCDDKLTALAAWLRTNNLYWDDIAYVGDDLNDLDCLQLAGISICPSDATPVVKECVDIQLTRKGGDGCLREIMERLELI
jgi:YrbI family 3-deoxy-D-manno-octulosonate 8-phosphate phosphatase